MQRIFIIQNISQLLSLEGHREKVDTISLEQLYAFLCKLCTLSLDNDLTESLKNFILASISYHRLELT